MDTSKLRAEEVSNNKSRPRWKGTRRGYFRPFHPEKYEGDLSKIIYRSHLELRLMKKFDDSPNVLKWSSEETVIPYVKPTDGRVHRYFVDFKATIQKPEETEPKVFLIEAKWSTAMVQPKPPKKRMTKRYLREAKDWMINNAKWDAAKKVCEQKGWHWAILNEKEI